MAFRGDPAWDNRRRIGQGGTFNANPTHGSGGHHGIEPHRHGAH
jgi:hypothetical protein